MQAELSTVRAVECEQFRRDVLDGLRADQKHLPSKYFYDQRGSRLFDRICDLPEYYPTRTEMAIMHRHAPEMAECIGSGAMVVELGSGSSMKTGSLLKQVQRPICYVPVDISGEHLQEAAQRIAREFPDVEVRPLHADFSSDFRLPAAKTPIARRVAYFPGSTIGNFPPHAARKLLARIAQMVGPGGGLLIGYDLVKRRDTLERAYDDAQQVTAAFNKNLLRRINRELGGHFHLARFDHQAVYNASRHRVEMHLVSNADQIVSIGDQQISFAKGESIRTELSHKYRVESFNELAAQAGFGAGSVWTDSQCLFAVGYYPVSS
jgi:dimethylhistidine N-methyltransferase